ncbi:MAG: phage BR0599 family protein [Pseudomonadota bacterium]
MSYDARETSRDDAQPFYLFEFTRGTQVNRFTSTVDSKIAFGETFFSSAISHGKITTGGQVARDKFEIDFPPTDTFAQSQIGVRGPQLTTLTAWRNHEGLADTEARVIFKGRVIAGKPGTDKIVVVCSSIMSALKDQGLRRRILRTCDHVLYHGACRLNRADFEIAGSITASDGLTHTIAAAAGESDGYFSSGILDFGGVTGFIIRHQGNLIRTRAAIPGLLDEISSNGSAAVTIAPGCNRSRGQCDSRFNNLANFGGFPFIPEKDSFNGSSSF